MTTANEHEKAGRAAMLAIMKEEVVRRADSYIYAVDKNKKLPDATTKEEAADADDFEKGMLQALQEVIYAYRLVR